ncbi:tRNA-dihydrouridine synthase 4-like protein [Planoprotostelium fungivorum]|uniref:tRNA-dihydrouridine synthase n=1 Tax=Planoprotostelium fungivorum TaxID=1890364 RepID=A0A2P6NBN1_9EUKA|nr:tRNA-dihydrouridine synthase 4-like protein [Planoprotostelium fungivorum]
MVRYSKLPFRLLCLRWGCNLTFSPMIVAKDFNSSEFARDSEFTTNKMDVPLVVQFAANDAYELSSAAEKVVGHCQAIDINCGCPQRWVMSEGYGSALLKKPDLISDMVRMTKERTNLPVSIKIRVDDDFRKTVDIVQRVEKVGVDWISVHGRTPKQKSTAPVNVEAIKLSKEHAHVPVIANGDVFSLREAQAFQEETKVDGVMAARGILQNPALYQGYDQVPMECVRDFIDISVSLGTPFHSVHQHLMFMLYNVHNRYEKREFNRIHSLHGVYDYFSSRDLHWTQPRSSVFI